MKRILALILALCLLSGCSLAVPGRSGGDKLTGFFVTVSRRDGDALVDHWDVSAAGMEMISNHDQAGKRLYAQFIGTPTEVFYEFPAGCGLSCFGYDVEEDGEITYRGNTISPEIDVTLEYHAGTETPYRMDAVVYGTGDPDLILSCNPVYQTPDGSVYVLGAETMRVATDMAGSAWQKRQERTDGKGCAYSLTIQRVVLPECYVITEMSGSHESLRRSEYAPGELPECYTPGADAAYLILEAQTGEDSVRSVYSPGDDNREMDTYYPGEYGLYIKGYTKIEWEGAK